MKKNSFFTTNPTLYPPQTPPLPLAYLFIPCFRKVSVMSSIIPSFVKFVCERSRITDYLIAYPSIRSDPAVECADGGFSDASHQRLRVGTAITWKVGKSGFRINCPDKDAKKRMLNHCKSHNMNHILNTDKYLAAHNTVPE